jgi:hypothetical protein
MFSHAKPNKGHGVVTAGQSKEATLAEAGLSIRTANRYEELAAPQVQARARIEELAGHLAAFRLFGERAVKRPTAATVEQNGRFERTSGGKFGFGPAI